MFPEASPQADALQVKTAHTTVSFKAETADTQREKETGLMHRTSLGKDQGMLFLWPKEQAVYMWMKDTPLSLDMLFIDRNGKIVHIEERTTPMSTHLIAAPQPVLAVLEIAGGVAEETGIKVGDQVIHEAFAP